MRPRTILVTGATSGIGLETAKQLAAQGHHVVIHGRTEASASAARTDVLHDVRKAHVDVVHGDLSRVAEVERLADDVARAHADIDVVVHNAGVYHHKRKETLDGIEETFAVNHLAPFLLTEHLLPVLQENAPARIVVVASRAHHNATLHLDDPEMAERHYVGWLQYCNTKLMNILFTRALHKRIEGTGVTVNCLHPGFVATKLARDFAAFDAAFKLLGMSPRKGAETSVHLAASPDVEGRSGLYWAKKRPVPPAKAAENDDAAERLWDLTRDYLD